VGWESEPDADAFLAGVGSDPAARLLNQLLDDEEAEAGAPNGAGLEAGHAVRIDPPDTIADGMRTQQPGALTFPIVQRLVERVMTVSDQEVKDAMRFLLLRMKLLVEPTGAVPVALLLSGRLDLRGQRVGVILSGGNADPGLVAEILGP